MYDMNAKLKNIYIEKLIFLYNMLNLKTFALFESNNYNFTLEDVRKLPLYSRLVKMGFEDTTTDRIWNNGNMRFYNYQLKMTNPEYSLTIYGNGPIRKTTMGNPYILKRFPEIKSLEDFNLRFYYVMKWGKKLYKKIHKKEIDFQLSPDEKKSITKVLVDIYKEIGAIPFLPTYNSLSDDEKDDFLKEINQTKERFEKNIKSYLRIRKIAFL